MAHVTPSNRQVWPRRRARKLGSVGAIVFVLVAGGIIATAVAFSMDSPAPPRPAPADTSTAPRESPQVQGEAAAGDGASAATARRAGEAPKSAIEQDQTPRQTLWSSRGRHLEENRPPAASKAAGSDAPE